jgi:hypothetical protein
MDWEVDPQGINTGGWGLRLKTEDLAKFGQLFLQKGSWQGKQVLSKQWVEAASTIKIEQNPNAPQATKDASDWLQGYCYQMWRCRQNAYRGDGAFGQYIIVLPDEDAVIAITSMTADMQGELNLVWQYLLPAMEKSPLPADEKMAATLKQKISSLALPVPEKAAASPVEKRISGQAFALQPNENQIKGVSFRFADNLCHVTLKTATTAYELNFGSGAWEGGETTRHGPYLVSKAKASLTGLPLFKTMGVYKWKDENTLELTLRYIESPHTETFLCRFNQNSVSIDIQNNVRANEKLVLQGEARKDAAAMR